MKLDIEKRNICSVFVGFKAEKELVEFADSKAGELGCSRSEFIKSVLRAYKKQVGQ